MTAVVVESRSAHLRGLTGLRFYAALLVVVHHVTRNLAPIPGVHDLFLLGGVGVSFFFILSGFVLTWTRNPDVSRRVFYRNRIARVFPLHLLTWTVAGVFVVLTTGNLNPWVAGATLILIQSWVPFENFYFGMNGPSWSLSCEAFFYAVFPLLSNRIAPLNAMQVVKLSVVLFAAAGALSIAGHVLFKSGPTIGLFYVNPLYRIWEFMIGIALALMIRRGWRTSIRPPVAAALTAAAFGVIAGLNYILKNNVGPFADVPFDGVPADLASLVLAPFFALLIATVASAELRGVRLHLQSALLVRLGEWSFALYLSHLLIVEALRLMVPHDLGWVGSIFMAMFTIAGAIAVSACLYHCVEKPLQRKLRSRTVARRLDKADA